MSDESLLKRFEKFAHKLINRDGKTTYIPSIELHFGPLAMSAGVNCYFHKHLGGASIWAFIQVADADGTFYYRRRRNGKIQEEATNLEKVKQYMPLIMAEFPLDALADV